MENKEKAFWNWFVENKQLFENILSNMSQEVQPQDIEKRNEPF